MSKKYEISISKRDSRDDFEDIAEWINNEVKHNWTKKEYKHTIVYTFYDMNDAFRFKMRWTFA